MSAPHLTLAAAFTLAGCGASAPPPAQPPMLESGVWMLSALGDDAVTAPISLTLKGERIEGVGPCNRYFGAFRRDGAALSIGPIAATRRACPELALEQRYFAALTDVAGAQIEGDQMALRDAEGAELMRLARAR